MKKIFWIPVSLVFILGAVYFLGPKPPQAMLNPTLPTVNSEPAFLEIEIAQSEKTVKGLKPDNEARIVWADSSKKEKTPLSLVYIHGFGASWAEGEPVHTSLARRYGANLYLARLQDAGITDPDAYSELTPESFLEGAKRALAIGKALGDEVILIGNSAGGLLSVYLAANNPDLKGLILYAPCLDIYDSALKPATGPWGEKVVKTIVGERMLNDYPPERKRYWMSSYSSNGLVTLQQTMDEIARPEVYSKIRVPVFVGYYYKNEEEQDKTVSVAAIRKMFPLLGTPDALKREVAFPDAGHHVVTSYLTSKDLPAVQKETERFLDEVLKIEPVNGQELGGQ